MDVKSFVGYLASAALLVLAALFALASVYMPTRLITSALLFLGGFGILYYTWKSRPTQIIQKVEVPGKIRVESFKCPNCSAPLNVSQMMVVDGVPTVKCSYCGYVFEVTEEPKW